MELMAAKALGVNADELKEMMASGINAVKNLDETLVRIDAKLSVIANDMEISEFDKKVSEICQQTFEKRKSENDKQN